MSENSGELPKLEGDQYVMPGFEDKPVPKPKGVNKDSPVRPADWESDARYYKRHRVLPSSSR